MANCTKCGARIASGKKFCTKCGTPVGAAPETPPAQESAAPAAVATPAQESAVSAASPAQVERNPEVISTGGYIGSALLMCVPVIGLVIFILWACGVCKSVNRRNYARATLILWAVGLVLGIIIYLLLRYAIGSSLFLSPYYRWR